MEANARHPARFCATALLISLATFLCAPGAASGATFLDTPPEVSRSGAGPFRWFFESSEESISHYGWVGSLVNDISVSIKASSRPIRGSSRAAF
jgi:hypothetical protein